jgi:hypothetical protein
MHKRHAYKNPSHLLQDHVAFRDGASLKCPTCERGDGENFLSNAKSAVLALADNSLVAAK